MANPEHLAILKQGVAFWNEWRKENPELMPDFSEADLINAKLAGVNLKKSNLIKSYLSATNLNDADLSSSNLIEAILVGASLMGASCHGTNFMLANLSSANLKGADLRRATLQDARLIQATLTEANLRSAYLYGADLSGANLENAAVEDAIIGWTIFGAVDLSRVVGLDKVSHQGPSIIGIDTLYRSGGNIPETFLRGCGIPDTFIEFSRSLVGKPIEFYSCFISHSGKDRTFCERLYADLQAKGVRVWYFPEDAKWGESVWGEIDRSIKIYDKLVVVCSENSLTSGPVLREIERALRREDEERKNILFPITIDDYIFDEWEHPRKADVLAKVVGDFKGWNRDADKYDAAFEKLLKALKAGQ